MLDFDTVDYQHASVVGDDSTKRTEESTAHLLRGGWYTILEKRPSDAATIVFARHKETQQIWVMKVLDDIADERRQQHTVQERHHCQEEALRWNHHFSPDIVLGLAPILAQNDREICIGPVRSDPTEKRDPHHEEKDEVLLMERLPDEQELDCLLQQSSKQPDHSLLLKKIIGLLVGHVAHMHTALAVPAQREIDGMLVGSFEQLRWKFWHNMHFFDKLFESGDGQRYHPYKQLKPALSAIFKIPLYQQYFELRMQGQKIKRCHGDLKSKNIWIDLDSERISVLDAVDFNPLYCNIDILSDVAMLIVDFQIRSGSVDLTNELREQYLQCTTQDNDCARAVLTYYEVEKAIVSAAVSSLYDHESNLAVEFLEVATMRMRELES